MEQAEWVARLRQGDQKAMEALSVPGPKYFSA